ncbi:MAG TPA: hypothetical protein VE646_02195 [Actinomycetota bacterium]|jgi:hypothetical protein|nr:hypothetical protein [Actinomycetota bacterium]
MIGPQITHVPCDLNQQRKRQEARRDSVARAVARRLGRRSLWDRVLRRQPRRPELTAEDLRLPEGEDVHHSLLY